MNAHDDCVVVVSEIADPELVFFKA
eukprot:SAG31_NODE_12837_length_913_cov_1.124079_1_plen_24_part_10